MRLRMKPVATFFVALAMIVSVFGAVAQPTVEALCPGSCEWPAGGRDYFHGYYLNQQVGFGDAGALLAPIPTEAPIAVTNATEFIALMQSHLFDITNNSINRHTGAVSPMINLMLGRKGSDFASFDQGVLYARNNWNTWRQLILQYEADGNVNWNQINVNCAPYDQANLDQVRFDVYMFTMTGGGCTTDAMIVFRNPDTGGTFSIKKICGNFMGDTSSLVLVTTPPPPPPPPPTPTSPPQRPYMNVTGGDTQAGVSMATPTQACAAAPHNTRAGIAGWNRRTPTYAGAGDEYAAMALGQIKDFTSGQGVAGAVPGGMSLTFSNIDTGASVDPATGVFGGVFGTAPCVDLWANKPADADLTLFSGNSVSALNGNYRATGNVTLDASSIPSGSHITLYVQGNVAIRGNISLQSTGRATRADIPSFRLIVYGSIFIGSSVTSLDGVYAAIPDINYPARNNSFANPIRGTISTCATDFDSFDPPDYLTTNYRVACSTPLTINGSVIANQFWPLRTFGDLTTTGPAERINYTPDTWMAIDPSAAISPDPDYQSIISLPPVL